MISRKGQFFIVTTLAIVTILFFVSRWIEPANIPDTSAAVLREETFTFDNIREKTVAVVEGSESCDDLNYNLQEFGNFIQDFAREKNYKITFNYDMPECLDAGIIVNFDLSVVSQEVNARGSFTVAWGGVN